MATTRTTSTAVMSTLAGLGATIVLLVAASAPDKEIPAVPHAEQDEEYEEEGYAAAKARQQEPDAIEAAFPFESYRPGTTAALRIWTATRGVTVRVFHVGPEPQLTIGNKQMEGVPVNEPRRFAVVGSGTTIAVEIGDWPSGLYFAKLTSPGRVGFAPFVVRPKRLGEHRVAIVLPTRTWQAYNFRDDGGDGKGDTWYATQGHLQSLLGRPFLNRGVPRTTASTTCASCAGSTRAVASSTCSRRPSSTLRPANGSRRRTSCSSSPVTTST
jgi:N,N-dimethylformamidase beta subunit-like protein